MAVDEVPIIRPLEAWRRDYKEWASHERTGNSREVSIMRRYWAGIAAASVFAFCGTLNAAQAPTPTPNLPQVPEVYKFVPGWPKPLPHGWVMGNVTGMFVDKEDHIWVLSRPEEDSKSAAPAVLEFDTDGNLLKS